MPDNLPHIPIPHNTWVDLYGLSGVTVGQPLVVENVGVSDIRLAVQAAEPAPDHGSYNVLKRDDDIRLVNTLGDLGAWAFSGASDGLISVAEREGFQPLLNSALHDGFGRPILSFKGALSVYDSDVNALMVNEHLRIDEGTTDTLTANVLAGSFEVVVTNGANFTADDRVTVEEGVLSEHGTFKVVTVTGNTLRLDKPLEDPYSVGAIVKTIIKSMNVDGSITPVFFTVSPPPTEIWHIYRLTIAMVHTGQPSDDRFGDLAKLPKGLVLRQENGFRRNLSVWRDNTDIVEDTGVDLRYSAKAGGGLYGTAARWTFKRAGTVLALSGLNGETFKAIVQDDLSALFDLEVKIQGHVEGV